jgi:hypothetical protein
VAKWHRQALSEVNARRVGDCCGAVARGQAGHEIVEFPEDPEAFEFPEDVWNSASAAELTFGCAGGPA